MTSVAVKKALKSKSSPARRERVMSLFKTGRGSYSEGDQFIGVRVPDMREVAKTHQDIELSELKKLLTSSIHEERYTALLIMVQKFQAGDERPMYNLYMAHLKYVNNWDLVDASAHWIVGAYLHSRSKKPLVDLTRSQNMWERRVAMVACQYFIRAGDVETALNIAEILVYDDHDLMHKAVGWMLREAGKKDLKQLKSFLNMYAPTMPRTALRYAIEKFPEPQRQRYLKMKIL